MFFSLGAGNTSVEERLALLFFVQLLYELLPFCYMSFYVADRRFFAADVANGLYHPSAYYLSAIVSGQCCALSLCSSHAACALCALPLHACVTRMQEARHRCA